MDYLSNCQKDTLAIIYNDGLNNDVWINSGVDQVRKLVKADKYCVFDKLSKGHSCYIITSAIIKNKCIKVR